MSFRSAYIDLIVYEGGYSNDKDDKGGETYKGISRVYNPDWGGWFIIDELKKMSASGYQFSHLLENNQELQRLVQNFYKKEYWDKFRGDDLPPIISEELFEQSVNLGNWKTAGKQLQKALNLLNRNGKLFDDLKVDGIIGTKTLQAVNKVNDRRLLKVLNGLQFMHYYNIDIKHHEYEKFVGWFDRI